MLGSGAHRATRHSTHLTDFLRHAAIGNVRGSRVRTRHTDGREKRKEQEGQIKRTDWEE